MNVLGAHFLKAGRTDNEVMLIAALAHLMHKDHPFNPLVCDGCLDVAAWLTIPGYQGERHGPF